MSLLSTVCPITLMAVAILSCHSSSEPSVANSLLLATAVTAETDAATQELILVDAAASKVVGRMPLAGSLQGLADLPNASSAIALTASDAAKEVFGFDIASLRQLWKAPLPLDACCSAGQTVRVADALGLLVLPPQDIVFFNAKRTDESGLAIVDAVSRSVRAFAPDSSRLVVGAALLPKTTGRADVMIVTRPKGASDTRSDRIEIRDGTSLTTLTVITRTDLGSPEGPFLQVLGTSSGARIFAVFPTHIVVYDIPARTVVARRAVQIRGRVSISPDDEWICISDQGVWPDAPGSGLLRMINADLSSDRLIDVSTPLGGRLDSPTAIVTGPTRFSQDGKTLFVRTGTTRFGPLYPAQPARVLVVDLNRDTVIRTISLGGFDAFYLVAANDARR